MNLHPPIIDTADSAFDRRRFARMLVAGFVLTPLIGRAQTPAKMRRIGFLSPADPFTEAEIREDWKDMEALGWIEGKNVIVERRFGNFSQMREFAEELVRLKVELIRANGTDATLAAKEATSTIPIIMDPAADPIGTGLVASLARPGGNVTGYSLLSSELVVKRVALVRELLPGLRRVVVAMSSSRVHALGRNRIDAAHRSGGVEPIFVTVTSAQFYRDGIEDAARQGAQAVHDMGLSGSGLYPPEEIAVATRARLPVITQDDDVLQAGALMLIASDNEEQSRRVAAIVDKILKGAKPADIPVEQPTRFRMVINLKAAKTLGLTIPKSMLYRADDVIR
jgi:putative ABC transport system substrate-binding protein